MSQEGEPTPISTEPQGSVEIDTDNPPGIEEGEKAPSAPPTLEVFNKRQSVIEALSADISTDRDGAVEEGEGTSGEDAEEGESGETQAAKAAETEDQSTKEGVKTEGSGPKEGIVSEHLVQGKDGTVSIRLKVDGEERILPLTEAQAELQRRESGNDRLRRAAQAQKSLEEQAEALTKREEALKGSISPSATDEGKSSGDLREKAASVVNLMMIGDEDAAVEELTNILQRQGASPATESTDTLVEQAVAKAREEIETQTTLTQAFDSFKQEFPELVESEDAFKVADMIATEISEADSTLSPADVMQEAGRRTRELLKIEPKKSAPSAPERKVAKDSRQKVVRMPPGGSSGEVLQDPQTERKPFDLDTYVAQVNATRSGQRLGQSA